MAKQISSSYLSTGKIERLALTVSITRIPKNNQNILTISLNVGRTTAFVKKKSRILGAI